MVSAVRPCFKGLRRVLALPAAVRGPVDFCALRRLAAICFAVDTCSSAFRMAVGFKVWGVVWAVGFAGSGLFVAGWEFFDLL